MKLTKSHIFFWLLIPLVLFVYSASAAGQNIDGAKANESTGSTVVLESQVPSYYLHFQGRILEPGTNNPKPDGSYTMKFRLYTQEAGTSPLWIETKSLEVQNGLFSTNLGDTTPLNLSDFNGQDLWLGVKIGSDPETVPRQQLAYTPYALNALMLGGLPAQNYAVEYEPIYAESIQYSAPRTHYLSIPGAAFQPRDGSLDYISGSSNSGAYYRSSNGSVSDQMNAPVYLPDGAYITSFTAYYYDNSLFYDLEVTLYRHNGFSGYQAMGTVLSSGNAPSVRSESTSSISFRVVDNSDTGYIVSANVPGIEWGDVAPLIGINGVVIEYTLDEAP